MTENRTREPGGFRSLWLDPLGKVSVRALQILLLIALASVVIWGLLQVRLVVITVLIALIIAAAVSPFVNWLRRHNVPSALATWLALLLGLGVLGGVITLIVFAVRNQWDELVDSASQGFAELQSFLNNGPLPLDQIQFDELREQATDYLTSSQFGNSALAGVNVVVELITGFFLLVVILFFFLKDGGRIWRFFLRPVHGDRLVRARRVGHRGMTTLGSYVRGTALIALVDAAGIGIALFVLQVPLALPLAVIVFLGAFIPIVGATVAGALAALVALVTNGPVVALIVVGVIIVVQQLEGNLLQPIVMGNALKLHPLVVLLALTAGTILAGIIGAVLAVPIAAVVWAAIKAWNAPVTATDRAQLREKPPEEQSP